MQVSALFYAGIFFVSSTFKNYLPLTPSKNTLMNNQILTEIEVNRKIYLFQKAVERYMAEKTIANSQAVAKAKAELCKFAMQVVS